VFKAACNRTGRVTNFQQWIRFQNRGGSNCHRSPSKSQSFSAVWSVVTVKRHFSIAFRYFGIHSFHHTRNHNVLSL